MTEGPEDDWFSGSEMRPPPGPAQPPVEDDWLEDDLRPRPQSFDLASLADRRILIPAAVFIVLLVAVLAALGAFSGGSPPPSALTTTTGVTTTTTPAQTTTTTPVAPAAQLPPAPLKPGATGAQVKLLQRALATLGYLAGVVDGQYGPATTQAVTAFQKAKGLTADGVFGPVTRQAMTAALG